MSQEPTPRPSSDPPVAAPFASYAAEGENPPKTWPGTAFAVFAIVAGVLSAIPFQANMANATQCVLGLTGVVGGIAYFMKKWWWFYVLMVWSLAQIVLIIFGSPEPWNRQLIHMAAYYHVSWQTGRGIHVQGLGFNLWGVILAGVLFYIRHRNLSREALAPGGRWSDA